MSRLRELAEQATPGPWEATEPSSFHTTELRAPSPHNGFALIKVMTNRDADLALIALAPDLCVLLADAKDALAPQDLARRFHEAYERLAPTFGYETRKASAVSWDEVPEPNRSLMIAVCGEIVGPLLARIEELEGKA